MKAIELTETGGPEVMHLREIPTPTPQQDEVLIRVAVTGINFIDLYVREGRPELFAQGVVVIAFHELLPESKRQSVAKRAVT